jgi:hypothetical protein
MNDAIAEEVLEDHRYLLSEVQNRAAIAYFAAANRNLSLYNALRKYMEEDDGDGEGKGNGNESDSNALNTSENMS